MTAVADLRSMDKEPFSIPPRLAGPANHPERLTKAAIKRHWDPGTIDLSADREAVGELSRSEFTRLRGLLAQFGAGEQAVTEDLAPLSVVLDAPDDQRYIATQLYDETRHAELFDRYWEVVIRPEEEDRGLEPTGPADDRWQHDDYRELFDRTADAMTRLLERDEPETRTRAFCHYHLTVEGILAVTAYEWVETRYGGQVNDIPELPGLVEGFGYLRRDEGRHVSFGTAKVRELLEHEDVPSEVVVGTLSELVPLLETIIGRMAQEGDPGVDREELLHRVAAARNRRLEGVGITPVAHENTPEER